MDTLDRTRPPSTRVCLARLAEEVVARTEGVTATRGSGRWLTADGERSIDGVVVGLSAGALADVELHLIAEWPARPLPALADELRWELRAEAAGAGLGDSLGEIEISVHDFVIPGEAAPGDATPVPGEATVIPADGAGETVADGASGAPR